MHETSVALLISQSTLNSWDKLFDEKMRSLVVPENRGKNGKVTAELVRVIVSVAKGYKSDGRRIRLGGFTKMLNKEKGIVLSSKTVGDVLTANGLRHPKTRKKRPRFYQKLRQEIPNGLLSIDGSEIKVWINSQLIKLNLEMVVDTNTFTHTAFSVSESETSEEFIKVLEDHRSNWGGPLGILCDSGTPNLCDASIRYLKGHDIELVSAGPFNAKGNGSIEGAFSLLKSTIGNICLDASSPFALAKSALETVISVYIKMRNSISLKRDGKTPELRMKESVSEQALTDTRQKLKDHIKTKVFNNGNDPEKIGRLHFMIRKMGIKADSAAISRAEKTISTFNMKAILAGEEAFIKAVNRKPERLNLSYFFGILKRIQQDQDDQEYKNYCRDRYNYNQLIELGRRQQEWLEKPKAPTVPDILNIIRNAVKIKAVNIRKVCLRRAQEWMQELVKSKKYIGSIITKFKDGLDKMPNLVEEEKEKIWQYVEELLNLKTDGKSVTQFS